jgi:hypothetical protein
MLVVGYRDGGGGGITSLTEDVLASGSGAVPAEVVAARDGTFLFAADGTITTTVGSSPETGPWRLGASTGLEGVRMYVGETAVTTPSSSNHVLFFDVEPDGTSQRTTLNAADATGLGLTDLTVGREQNIELEGAFGGPLGGFSIGIPGHHGNFFGGTGSGIPFGQPNVISINNTANTNLALSNLLANTAQLYAALLSDPTTDVGPKGFVYLGGLNSSTGTGGAISSMAPNGTGTLTTQLGIGILERFYAQTTAATPSETVNYPLPVNGVGNCVFIGKVWATGTLHTVGGGGGTLGDRYSIGYNVQGSVRTSATFPFPITTTVTITPDMALDADVSMLGNTFVITGSAVAAQLTFTPTGVLAGGQGTINWQWDLDLKVL